MFDVSLFLSALGLACVLESLPWLLAPGRMREALRMLLEQPDNALRLWGVTLLGLGLLLVFVSR